MEVANRYERQAQLLYQFKDPESAAIVQEILIQILRQAQQGLFDEHAARECIDKLLALVGKPGLEAITIRKEFESWLEVKKGSASGGTYRSYKHTVESFLEFLGSKADANLAALTASDVDRFRIRELKQGKAPATVLTQIKALRAVLNRSRKFGRILTNPAEAVDVGGVDSQGKQPFTLEQVQSLMAVADWEWKGMILIGYYLGARIGDAAHMRWVCVDFEACTISFRQQKQKRGSIKKPVTTVLMPELRDYLREQRERRKVGEFVFPTLGKTPVSGTGGLSLKFGKLITAAGIKNEPYDKKVTGKGRDFYPYGFHSFRHTSVAIMERLGVSEEIRMLHVGHTSDAHARYSHREVESIRQALKDYPTISPPSTTEAPTPPPDEQTGERT